MVIEKFLEVTYLYDFYQELLTDKQSNLLSGYYFEDLSLGELAAQHQISRQSVFDTIKKAEQKCLDYEAKLGLWQKYQSQEKILTDIKKKICQLDKDLQDSSKESLQALVRLVDKLINEM